MRWISYIIDWFLPQQVRQGDQAQREEARLVIGFSLAMSVWGPIFTVLLYTVINQPLIAHSAACFTGFGGLILFFGRKTKFIRHMAQAMAGVLLLELIYLACITGGISGAALTWAILVPVISTLVSGVRAGAIWTAAVVGVVVLFMTPWIPIRQVYRLEELRVIHGLSLAALTILTFSLLALYERFKKQMIHIVSEHHNRLTEADASLAAVLAYASDAIFTTNEQGNIKLFNAAAERLFGYKADEIIGQKMGKLLTSEEFEAPDMASGTRSELVGRRKDGSTFLAELALSEVPHPGRKLYTGIVRDVTQRKHAQQQLQSEHRLLKKVLSDLELERQMLAYEIHDGLVQFMTGAKMHLEAASVGISEDDEWASSEYIKGLHTLREGIAEARRLIGGLRPPLLDEVGLVPAIEYLVEQYQATGGPTVELQLDRNLGRLASLTETALYRICQEALTNAKKYSKADKVFVQLTDGDNQIKLVVEDHGVGFELAEVGEDRFGLEGIRERAKLLNGTSTITSRLGSGVRIEVSVPVQRAQALVT